MKTSLLSILVLLLMAVTDTWAQTDLETPLTLEAKTDGTIIVSSPKSGMKYSLDGGVTKTAVTATINVNIGNKVEFYGNGTGITSYQGTMITGGTAECYIYGNIMSLVDETGFATNTTLWGLYPLRSLFQNNTKLVNHSSKKLVLPATTLREYCYTDMFNGCTGLTEAPTLPATTLATSCYFNMFKGCTGLTEAPTLPATTLASSCYSNMFNGCTSLTKAPTLPATTLASSCYYSMFNGCTGLAEAPELPATTLANNCYQYMFQGCTSLTKAPELPATTLANNCYTYMFQGCTSLTTAPELPATTLKDYCYQYMFQGCTSLTAAPELPATTLANSCYTYMFNGCTSLTIAPELPATTLANNCYRNMFRGCTGLTEATELPATTLASSCYYSMFNGCTGLAEAPELPATTLATECYSYMFYGCTGLAEAPELPATTLKDNCYQYMFQGCTSLTTAPELPATTLANNCYQYMFYGCTSLTTAPVLPATTLESGCYRNMFYGCTNLNSVICLATTYSSGNTDNWLSGVAATGTFTKAKGATWPTGSYGIPSGWTILENGVLLTDDSDVRTALSEYAGSEIFVTYTRSFTKGKPSTVCLPFEYTKKTRDGSFYTFSGITKNSDGEYIATMTESSTSTLTANTPYLYMPSVVTSANFSGTHAIPASITAGETSSGDWKFIGTFETKEWATAPETPTYGFSAQDANDGIKKGEFVRVGNYVRIRPMRAYLEYTGSDSQFAKARSMSATVAEQLPETISVRLIGADGNVTAIGTLHTLTGEVTTDGWYTLDGKRLSTQPTQKGIYVNNGKKVIIK